MPLPESRIQAVDKLTPPFLKGIMRSGYLHATAGRLCLGLCGLPMDREVKDKVSIEPLHGPHSVQAQEAGGEVDGIPADITRPATESAFTEAHGGVLVMVEGAQCPPPSVKGQAVVTGGILGTHSLPDFAEYIGLV